MREGVEPNIYVTLHDATMANADDAIRLGPFSVVKMTDEWLYGDLIRIGYLSGFGGEVHLTFKGMCFDHFEVFTIP